MRLELTGRHLQITPLHRRLVDQKLTKLERLVNGTALSAQVVLTGEKNRVRADVTLHARGEKFLHGVGAADAWEASVVAAIEKISQQAQRLKGKRDDRKRRGAKLLAAEVEAAPVPARAATRVRMPKILRTSRQTPRLLSLAAATRQLDAEGNGILVFRDAESETISVLYRGSNGELALVETEA